MASERYEIVRVKGSNPEKFVKVWFTADRIPIETSEPKSEAEWRADFAKEGRGESEINSLVQRAKEIEA